MLTIGLIATAGCDNSDPDPTDRALGTVSRAGTAHRNWLEISDTTRPELWLTARSAGANGSLQASEGERLRILIASADLLFHETPRMIANRTAQLQQMLASRAIVESAAQILSGFVTVASTREKSGYGDLCQHYFNLRIEGLGRDEALARLAKQSVSGN